MFPPRPLCPPPFTALSLSSIVAGNAWYNFVFPVILVLVSVTLSLSTLDW